MIKKELEAKKFIKAWALAIITDFIEQNWSVFEQYCKDFGVSANEIYTELKKRD